MVMAHSFYKQSSSRRPRRRIRNKYFILLSQALRLHSPFWDFAARKVYGVGVAVVVGSRFEDLEKGGMDIGVNVGVMVGVGVGFRGVQPL